MNIDTDLPPAATRPFDQLIDTLVHAVTYSTSECHYLELRSEVPLPAFEAGAHIDIHLDEGLIRQYSLCNSPDETYRYLICVQRRDNGRGGSLAIHERLRVGDSIRISRPRNNFPLEPASNYILLAGGIGVTPLASMAQHLHSNGTPFELHLYTRGLESAPLLDILQKPHLRHHVTIHTSDNGDSIRNGLPASARTPASTERMYICGPQGFIEYVLDEATAVGWPNERLHVERFAPTQTNSLNAAARESFTVVIASTGQQFDVGPEETIASALTAGGVEVELSCEQGMCGACLTGVIAGIPEHHDDVQTPAEHATNTAITICCSRSRTPELILDL